MEDSARVREIQLALKAAGFDPGPVDGQLGTRTKTAIRDFQTANGLMADGKVGPKTWGKLESYLNQASSND
jgi:peptidoglycan hydrolase-like protein with peptidoglycan-binding domain